MLIFIDIECPVDPRLKWVTQCLRAEDQAGSHGDNAIFSAEKGRDVTSTTQDLQKSGSVKSPKGGVAGSLIALTGKLNKCLSKSRPRQSAPSRSRFELLPPELILKIEQYLSLSSALSLSHTRRNFRQTMKARVEDLSYLVDMKCVFGTLNGV